MKVYLKIFLALVVIIGALAWAVSSTRASSYSGTNLNMEVGKGVVTVTNPDAAPVDVQLVSAGTRSFSVSSSIDGVSGSSTTQGEGTVRTQLLEFAVPTGTSEFTITRGTNVSLVSTAPLDVYVQPLTENDTRTTIIVTAIVMLSAFYYISRTTNHRWIAILRGKPMPEQTVDQPTVTAAVGQGGSTLRAYGDNRADISTPSTPL